MANKFKEVMRETRDQDWKDWLESVSQQDLYIANKYISNEPSDYSNARIPPLHTTINRLQDTAKSNEDKVKALAELFFPLLPLISHVPLDQTYPTPLQGLHFFSRSRICQVISELSHYRVPGADKIPNMVLMKCVEALIDHLFFIFRAVLKLKVGFGTGIPRVGIFHTVPVTGTGTYRTVICAVSHGYHANPWDI